jgi:hypothetical protein
VHFIIEIAMCERIAIHARDMHPDSDAMEALRNVGLTKNEK